MKNKILALSLLTLSLVGCSGSNTYKGKIYYQEKNQDNNSFILIGFENDKMYWKSETVQRTFEYVSTIKGDYVYKYEYRSYLEHCYFHFEEDFTILELKFDNSYKGYGIYNLDKENIYSLNDLKKRL